MIEIARLFNVENCTRRDIVLRLMASCEAFKRLHFHDALESYRYFEKNGLIVSEKGYIVIYFDCN